MARIRSIHPGLFTDEAFVSISASARVLLIGLLCEADDNGVFEWKPATLKMRILPADSVKIETLLDELVSAHIVMQFAADDRRYGAVRNFVRYQRPKYPKVSHPLSEKARAFVGLHAGDSEQEGPMAFTRDVTARERQSNWRAKQQPRNGSRVTKVENETDEPLRVTDEPSQKPTLSRQMEEEGGRREKNQPIQEGGFTAGEAGSLSRPPLRVVGGDA